LLIGPSTAYATPTADADFIETMPVNFATTVEFFAHRCAALIASTVAGGSSGSMTFDAGEQHL
jgi:hypothetical protein